MFLIHCLHSRTKTKANIVEIYIDDSVSKELSRINSYSFLNDFTGSAEAARIDSKLIVSNAVSIAAIAA
jgi:hypothetical protein